MLDRLRSLTGNPNLLRFNKTAVDEGEARYKHRPVANLTLPPQISRDQNSVPASPARRVAVHNPAGAEAFYARTGQCQPEVVSSMNTCTFTQFWREMPGSRDADTVDHKRMHVNEALREEARRFDGVWHVKTPGRESTGEKLKRYFQKMMYWITGQTYKADYYDNKQLLAQKEVLAANVYKVVVDTPGDPHFNKAYQVGYSLRDAETPAHNEHCIASRHLDGYRQGNCLVSEHNDRSSEVLETRFHPVHNPVVDLVIRKFLLGDEDYLKLDNYMFAEDPDVRQRPARQTSRKRLVNIDFGMSFYNRCKLPSECSFEKFRSKMQTPSFKHRSQYRGKHTILTVIEAMERDGADIDALMLSALQKIAALNDRQIEGLAGHVHHPEARRALIEIMRFKRDQAAAIADPVNNPWPDEPGRWTLSALVARVRQTSDHQN